MKRKNGMQVTNIPRPVFMIAAFLIVGIVILAGTIWIIPSLNPFPSLDPRNSHTIALEKSDADEIILVDNLVDAQYVKAIYSQGKDRISNELEKVRTIPDPEAKLDEIFEWEMKNWVEPNDNLSAFKCTNIACSYSYLESDPSRIRSSPYYDGILYPQKNPNGTYYADDPYWIAFTLVGECREYSTLFAFMAQQSGIEAHLVRTNSHQWVEVELANGSYYYDPWCAHTYDYYSASDGNMTFRDKWFNKIGAFEDNCQPPDPYLISYCEFPYIWATPKYTMAYLWHTHSTFFNVTLPG